MEKTVKKSYMGAKYFYLCIELVNSLVVRLLC